MRNDQNYESADELSPSQLKQPEFVIVLTNGFLHILREARMQWMT